MALHSLEPPHKPKGPAPPAVAQPGSPTPVHIIGVCCLRINAVRLTGRVVDLRKVPPFVPFSRVSAREPAGTPIAQTRWEPDASTAGNRLRRQRLVASVDPRPMRFRAVVI